MFLAVALLLGPGLLLHAQSSGGEEPRPVKEVVTPEYPALAKQLKLRGTVKVEVVIAPDGKVKKAHVIGGHPLLAVEAEKAALLTRFEAAPKETTQVIQYRFGD
jgi:TonB family protein